MVRELEVMNRVSCFTRQSNPPAADADFSRILV